MSASPEHLIARASAEAREQCITDHQQFVSTYLISVYKSISAFATHRDKSSTNAAVESERWRMEFLTDLACVDDDPHLRAIIEVALTELAGLRVKSYGSGAEAIKGVQADPPQMILLDVAMPGMDGIETLRQLRFCRQTAHIPTVFVTGRAEQREIASYKKLGAAATIAKPFALYGLAPQVLEIWRSLHAGEATT
jgi:two-component system, OmpR family, response regulator